MLCVSHWEHLLLRWCLCHRTLLRPTAACKTSPGLAFFFVTVFRHLSSEEASSYYAVLFQAIHLNLIINAWPSVIGCLETQLPVDSITCLSVSLWLPRDVTHQSNPGRVTQEDIQQGCESIRSIRCRDAHVHTALSTSTLSGQGCFINKTLFHVQCVSTSVKMFLKMGMIIKNINT